MNITERATLRPKRRGVLRGVSRDLDVSVFATPGSPRFAREDSGCGVGSGITRGDGNPRANALTKHVEPASEPVVETYKGNAFSFVTPNSTTLKAPSSVFASEARQSRDNNDEKT